MVSRPLLWCAAAFIAGTGLFPVLFDDTHDTALPRVLAAPHPWAALAATALVGAISLALLPSRGRTSLKIAAALLLVGFTAAGRLALLVEESPPPGSFRRLHSQHEERLARGVSVSGVVLTARHRGAPIPREEIVVAVTSITVGRIPHPTHGRIALSVSSATPLSPHRGSRISAWARITLPTEHRNGGPGSLRRTTPIGWVKSAALIRIVSGSPDSMDRFLGWTDALRSLLVGSLRQSFPDTTAGRRALAVATALLFGEREGLSRKDRLSMAESGLTHLLAVSGFNVAVLVGCLLLLLRLVCCPVRLSCLLVQPLILLYLLLNREESSVIRAVMMASLYFLGRAIWRGADRLNAIGVAALAIAGSTPDDVFSPGFQLTFVATLALLIAPPIGRLHGHRPHARWRIRRGIGGVVIATLAAVIATAPLAGLHFNRIAPGAVPANLLAGPAMAGAFCGALAVVALHPILPTAAGWAGHAVTGLIDFSFAVSDATGRLPGASFRCPTPRREMVLLQYLLLALIVSGLRGPNRPTGRVFRVMACTGLFLLSMTPIDRRARPTGLRTTMLDVGQGESVLVETAEGERVLVDAGGTLSTRFDIGERVVSRALWDRGLTRLDVLAISHSDQDHAGGAASVVRNFGPAEIWIPGGEDGFRIEESISAGRARGAVIRRLTSGDTMRLQVSRVEVLGPRVAQSRTGTNDGSLVTRVRASTRSVLLTGDIGAGAEITLDRPSADLLKVGHHGSRTGTTAAFLRRVSPRVALISAGRDNRFGHPHPDVVERLHAAGVRVYRSDRHGAISVEMTEDHTRVRTASLPGFRAETAGR